MKYQVYRADMKKRSEVDVIEFDHILSKEEIEIEEEDYLYMYLENNRGQEDTTDLEIGYEWFEMEPIET